MPSTPGPRSEPAARALTFVVLVSAITGAAFGVAVGGLPLWRPHVHDGWVPLLGAALVLFWLAGPAYGQAAALRRWFPAEPLVFDDDDRLPRKPFPSVGWLLALAFPGEARRAPRSASLLGVGAVSALVSAWLAWAVTGASLP